MSTPIIKSENTVTGFKSRIPVVSGPHRPDTSKPLNVSEALGELSAGMRSKIPVLKNLLKNPKRQTPSSVTHSDAGKLVITSTGDQELQTPTATVPDSNKRSQDSVEQQISVLDTESRAALLQERVKGMNTTIQSSSQFYRTVASTANKPVNENARPVNSAVVIHKLSPPTDQATPATANKPVVTRKLSPLTDQATPATVSKPVVTRKLSPPTSQSVPIRANNRTVGRKPSPPTSQVTPAMANQSALTFKSPPPTGQPVSVRANNLVVSRKLSPPTGQPVPVLANILGDVSALTCSGQPIPTMANNAAVSRKLSPPTVPVLANIVDVTSNVSAMTCSGQSVRVIANKPVVSRKPSPPTCLPAPVMANKPVVARKLSSSATQSAPVRANNSVVNSEFSPPRIQSAPVVTNILEVTPNVSTLTGSGQSVPVIANQSVVARKLSPSATQSVPGVPESASNSAVNRKFSPTSQSVPIVASKPAVSRKPLPPTGLSAANKSVVARKLSTPTSQSVPVVNRKLSPPTGQSTPIMANILDVTSNVSTLTGSGQSAPAMAAKSVGRRKLSPQSGQFAPVMANKSAVSRKTPSTSSGSTPKFAKTVVGRTVNTPRPPVPAASSSVQLKAAIRQTKAARYLKKIRHRNAPLPGAPQLAPKRVVLAGDYARPKRTVGKSKLGECSIVESLDLNIKIKAGVKRNQKLVLGPKGRAITWTDARPLPFHVRVIKRTAYAALDNLPRGNPYRYSIYDDE